MAKTIMIQGTMSSVGKSFITTGLCRVFWQDGYRAAPFKSQNMSRNVFVTREGTKMSVAQAVQAEAAGIAPEARMNPILLCPQTDTGSEVIVRGESHGVMGAAEYFLYRKTLIPEVTRAFLSLSQDYDTVVIEGAGSPAEINLRDGDIVNMGLAGMTDSPVILVGDIEPGGVFAQLLGTLMLLEDDGRERVKCVIINKFRGDIEILRPGLSMLSEKTGKPIAGVLPYLRADIDAEDSLCRGGGDGSGGGAFANCGSGGCAGLRDDTRAVREKQYDIIADGIREHLDMDLIYSILDRKI